VPGDDSALISRLLVLACAIGLTGCSSQPDWMYQQYFQLVRQSVAGSFGSHHVTREEAAAIPYASLGYRVDGSPQSLLVLASDVGGEELWTAKTRVVILTRDGRIVRTVGLAHDLSAVAAQGALSAPSSALKGPFSSVRLADFPDLAAYGTELKCAASTAGPETVSILGSAIRTIRVDESCRNAALGWSFVDNYWIDPHNSLVWRSRQHIHPKGETVEIEMLRPPG
jgi:hypothetical protein